MSANPLTDNGAKVDKEAVLAKYQAEREKRLRPEGNDQYIEPTGKFARFLEDPYVEPPEREPKFDEVMVAFIGGGFAGLLTGAKLKEAGIEDVRIFEKGGDFGGTWYWNRYPGAQCDTAAMIYLPLLEETGHIPTEKYTHAPEILQHSQRIAEHYGLYNNALLSTEVTNLTWIDDRGQWLIETNRGDQVHAKYVAMGTGPLHRAKLPGIPGIETFAGHCFHTSRWDYSYTGGNPAGAAMTGLADKRVGIIGTGATAVQCVPHLAKSCSELFVFQRTPSSIDIRNNHPIDAEWFEKLEPGWQEKWLANFTLLQTGGFADEDLVMDGWTDIAQRIRDMAMADPDQDFSPERLQKAYHNSDDEKMMEIRSRVDAVVGDPSTAEALKPWYRQLCKRPCFHDQYLDAYNNSNTHLIDTDGKGVQEIVENGVVVDGELFELDCLIFASGFEVGTDLRRRAGFETTGRDGLTLTDYWEDGMRSLHGIHVHGFPNAFIVGPTQGANLISNIPHNLTEAAITIANVINHGLKIDARTIEVSSAAEAAWLDKLEAGGRTFGGDPTCTPGYYNNEGKERTLAGLRNSLGYPEGPPAYFDYIKQWRTSGQFEGIDFSTQ